MKFVVAQLGARMHYAIPRMLHEAGILEHFYTDICALKGWLGLLRHIPLRLRPLELKRLLGRVPSGVPVERITGFPAFGIAYQLRRNSAATSMESTRTHLWAGKRFCELVLRKGLQDADAVYTFNSAGLELLEAARQRGAFTVMEQTNAPREVEADLLAAAQERYSGWEAPLVDDSARRRFIERERAEWSQADLILCGSDFVSESIARCGGPVEKCRVVPYGVDDRFSSADRKPHDGPLRVLTVGGVGLRKGSPIVLAVARELRGLAEFRMVGSLGIQRGARESLQDAVHVTGPVPRTEMASHFHWADVFLLPSLCEGSATVVYEALTAGLPVICTPNTGSVIRDGIEGYVVPIHDVGATRDALLALIESRESLHAMGANARTRSSEFTLRRYQQRLVSTLTESHQ